MVRTQYTTSARCLLSLVIAVVLGACTTLPGPNYDSGWRPIEQTETLVLNHDLGVSPDKMLVDLTFKAAPELGEAGVNNEFYGTSRTLDGFKGAWWSALTEETIAVFREEEDLSAEEVRVKIWIHR